MPTRSPHDISISFPKKLSLSLFLSQLYFLARCFLTFYPFILVTVLLLFSASFYEFFSDFVLCLLIFLFSLFITPCFSPFHLLLFSSLFYALSCNSFLLIPLFISLPYIIFSSYLRYLCSARLFEK